MPHLGKAFPRQWKNLVLNPFYPKTPGPTRNVVLNCSATPIGSIALKWAGQRVVSSIADYDPDVPTGTKYTWVSPLDSLATITLQTIYKLRPGSAGSFNRFAWFHHFKAWYDGDFIADYNLGFDRDGSIWGFLASGWAVGPSWDNESSISEWRRLGCSALAAKWADVPDYHPYRH